jgi:hypothetical protein
MKKRIIGCLIVAVLAISVHAQLSVFDKLQPQPKKVTIEDGYCSNTANIQFVKRVIEGVRPDLLSEAYELTILSDRVIVAASDLKGERYANVTLNQLIKLSDGKVPCGKIVDWPQYRWRGFMHDCGRNYLDIQSICKVLDLMATYKLNLFHWHITDYYGWRLESKKYPALQAPWAFRRQISKYYTQKEFREILDYANKRGITVMPELDVPGHTLAFRKGLNIEHMAERQVKGIICDLIDELCSLATPEEMPYVHLGTDEARTPWEQVPDSYCPAWADQVRKNGRIPVGWTPGKQMISAKGFKSVKMIWHDGLKPDVDEYAFDTVRLYFGKNDPLSLLNVAVFSKPFRYDLPEEQKLGPVMCSWHDDMLGEETSIVFRNNIFAPSIVMYSSLMWEKRDVDYPEYMVKLPQPGTADFQLVRKFEDRIVAQRDKVLNNVDVPFSFVKQTDLRWRVSNEKGKVVAKDVAQGTIFVRKWERDVLPNTTNSFIAAKTGNALLETWIHSETNRKIGAWIGFTYFSRSGGRRRGLQSLGEWDAISKGTKVELNGNIVQPPIWGRPGFNIKMTHPEEPTSSFISELPFTNEEFWMREPTEIFLNKGWNHVKITLQHTKDLYAYDWVATFIPVDGTSAHPREAKGLLYSSEPK